MNNIAYVLIALMTIVSIPSALAQEVAHSVCGGSNSIKVKKMGNVDEKQLQDHIDEVEARLRKMRHARGSHLSTSRKPRLHLAEMRKAMQSLHDQMYIEGCTEARHGSSLEARVAVLEKNLGIAKYRG